MDFRTRLEEISHQLDAETAKRETLEKMLDDSMLQDLLAKDLDLMHRSKPSSEKKKKSSFPRGVRTYRHKSDMIGDIKSAKEKYENAKRRLVESESELERLQREAKLATAKASVAKIKIKALLALMRKMIAHSGSAPSGKSHVLANDDVSALVEEKLRNISSMIPQYNASLEQVTRLAKDAAETSTAATGGSAASPISRASLSSGNGITTETKREDSMGNDEGAWDSLVQKISFSD